MWSLVAVHMDSSARSRRCSLPQPCISLVQVVGRVPAPPLRDCFLRHRWNEVTWGECRVNVKLHQRHRDTQTHADVHTYIQRLHTHVHTETHQHTDTCTHPHIDTLLHTHGHTWAHRDTHQHTDTHLCTHGHAHIDTDTLHTHVHADTCAQRHMDTHGHTHGHGHIDIDTLHTETHI